MILSTKQHKNRILIKKKSQISDSRFLDCLYSFEEMCLETEGLSVKQIFKGTSPRLCPLGKKRFAHTAK